MKLHFTIIFLALTALLRATTVQEIIDLKGSGFSEDEIIELLDSKDEFGAKEFIELKKNNFSKEFIIRVRVKLGELQKQNQQQIVQVIQPAEDERENQEEQIIEKVKKWNSSIRKIKAIVDRSFKVDLQIQISMSSDEMEEDFNEKEIKLADILSEANVLANDLPYFDLSIFPKEKYDSKNVISLVEKIESDYRYYLSYDRFQSLEAYVLENYDSSRKTHQKALDFRSKAYEHARQIIELDEKATLEFIPKNGPYEEIRESIIYKGTWKNSKNDGRRLSFYESGGKEGEDNWVDGAKVGQEVRWHSNGKKKYEATWNNTGTKAGVEQSWYESGQLKHKANWDSSGQKNGEESEFYPNGNPLSQSSWQNGSLTEIKKFKNNKELEFHRKFEGNIPVRIKQNLQGSDKYSEFNLDRKNQKGSVTFYDSNTSRTSTSHFFVTEDKSLVESTPSSYFLIKSGPKTFYFLLDGEYNISEDDFRYEGKYEKGIPVGLHKISSNENNAELNFSQHSESGQSIGKLKTTVNGTVFDGTISISKTPTYTGKVSPENSPETFFFEKNEMVKIIFGDGSKPSTVVTRNDNPAKFSVEDFYENRKSKAKLNFSNGYLEGVCELYRQDGTKFIQSEYVKGLRQGLTKIFHSNGNVSCEITYEEGEIKDKVSAFYEDGESYNPKSGFLSTKYTLKYSKDSIWRTGVFSKGMPSGKQLELNSAGEELQVLENIKSLGLNNQYYGIFEIRFEPQPNEVPSFRDYNKFQKSDFYRISSDYKTHFNKLNSIQESFHFMDALEAKLKSLELDVQGVSNLLNEKFTYVELPISKPTPTRAIFQYTVRSGDTLFSIANKFDTTMKAIRAHNLISTEDRLKIGQQIFIP